MNNSEVAETGKKRGRKPGCQRTGGRKAGTPNKLTASIKEAILGAFEASGGMRYLMTVAREHPQVFCALLGKLLPTEVSGPNGGPIEVEDARERLIDRVNSIAARIGTDETPQRLN